MKGWCGKSTHTLTSEDWFEKGHNIVGSEISPDGLCWPVIRKGKWIWAPPPATADVAIEQLRLAHLKRKDSTHIVICPRLLTAEWLKQFNKAVDLYIEIPAGCYCWPTNMYEPLILGVCLLAPPFHGRSEELQRCPLWSGRCVVWSRKKTWTQGIFCGNFSWILNG